MLLSLRPKEQGEVPCLEAPFVIEASSTAISMVHDLLVKLLPAVQLDEAAAATSGPTQRELSAAEGRVMSVLRLLKASLIRLVMGHVDPEACGIAGGDDAVLARVHRVLESVMEGSYHTALQVEAVLTLDFGLDVLYPDARRRADLLRSLIDKHQESAMAPDSSPYLLLIKLLERFSSAAGAVALLPPATGSFSDEQASQITELLNRLFGLLVQESRRELERGATDTPSDRGPTLLSRVATLLGTYQRHLLCLAHGRSSATQPACVVLRHYTRMLLAQCTNVLGMCQTALDGADGANDAATATARRAEVDRVLSTSIVGSLMPSLTGALCLFSQQAWLGVAILGPLVKFVSELDKLNRGIEEVVRSEQAAREADIASLVAAEMDRATDGADVEWSKSESTLEFSVVAVDPGEEIMGARNMLNSFTSSEWKTKKGENRHVLLRHTGGLFKLKSISVRSGVSPIGCALGFVSNSRVRLTSVAEYDGWAMSNFKQLYEDESMIESPCSPPLQPVWGQGNLSSNTERTASVKYVAAAPWEGVHVHMGSRGALCGCGLGDWQVLEASRRALPAPHVHGPEQQRLLEPQLPEAGGEGLQARGRQVRAGWLPHHRRLRDGGWAPAGPDDERAPASRRTHRQGHRRWAPRRRPRVQGRWCRQDGFVDVDARLRHGGRQSG